jgi:hypothetical protein
MKLTIHFLLVPRLRLSGAIPLLPLHAFMACRGTLPLPLYLVAKQHRMGIIQLRIRILGLEESK